jgi:hypothetical protein
MRQGNWDQWQAAGGRDHACEHTGREGQVERCPCLDEKTIVLDDKGRASESKTRQVTGAKDWEMRLRSLLGNGWKRQALSVPGKVKGQ